MPAAAKRRRRRARRKGRQRAWDRWRAEVLAAPEPQEPADTDGEPRPHFTVWKLDRWELYGLTRDDFRGRTDRELSDLAEVLFRLASGKPIPKRLARYVPVERRSQKRAAKPKAKPVQEETILVRAGGDGWTGGVQKRVTESTARRQFQTARERAERRLHASHERLSHAIAQADRLSG